MLAIACGAGAWWLLASLVFGLPLAATGSVLLLGYFALRQIAGIRADRRRDAAEQAIAHAIAALCDFIRSGSSINRALQQLSEIRPARPGAARHPQPRRLGLRHAHRRTARARRP